MLQANLAPFALGLTALGLLFSSPRVEAQDPEVIFEWNQLLQDTLPATAGPFGIRQFAMMHIAMFDSINSIEGGYSPYRTKVNAALGASTDAAAAQAAHDVLVSMIPGSAALYDAALANRLASLPTGPANQGVKVGETVARQIIAWRRNDGFGAVPPVYLPPPLPGLWQPTPPNFPTAALTQVGNMKPFALLTSTQYLPERPPTLTSSRYATDFNEVKRLGSATSTARTAEQTQLALLFAGVITRTNLLALWNNVARDTARSQFLSQIETARLFALINAAIHDGLQTSQTSKFIFGLWRPVTAIQRADEDLNPNTNADPDWLPLLVTPPYPAYAGNMACVGAAAARALALVHGTDEIPFTATWYGNATNPTDVSRNYGSFWRLALDEGRSRVVGGIHYTFDNRASQKVCPKVSEYAFENYMVPN